MKYSRLTVEAEYSEMGEYETSKRFPTLSDRGEVDALKEWLRQMELDLHFGEDVVRVQEALPFGVKQDDDATGVPPWAMPEALKAFDLARPEEARLTRLADERSPRYVEYNVKGKEKGTLQGDHNTTRLP